MRLGTVSFNAPFGPLDQFMFEQCTDQPRGLPAFLVGVLRKLGPQAGDGRACSCDLLAEQVVIAAGGWHLALTTGQSA